jgi:transposase
VKRVIFETEPLSMWFYHAFRVEGLPAIVIDAQHAKAALDMTLNKTNANNAERLAHLADVGFFRAVRVTGFNSMLTRTLVAAHTRLARICTELSNQIRGLMKTFGLIVPAARAARSRRMGSVFLSIRTNSLLSCCRCWRLGAT